MRLLLIALALIVLLNACTSGNKENIVEYGSEAFQDYTQDAPVSLEEAWTIQLQYLASKNKEVIGSPVFFIVNDCYLFTPYYNLKIPEVRMEGVCVDAYTGNVKYVNLKQRMRPKSHFGWIKNMDEKSP